MSSGPSLSTRCEQVRSFPRIEQNGTRRAAVALAIVPTSEGHALVLTERAGNMTRHAGQYALPGGLSEPGEDSIATALRETHEEIGVPQHSWNVLGQLDDYLTKQGTVISPVVLMTDQHLTYSPNPDEVEEVILLPIDHPRNGMEWVPGDLQPFGHPGAGEAQAVIIDGHMLFAPTGALIFQFLELWESGQIVRTHEIGEPVFASH